MPPAAALARLAARQVLSGAAKGSVLRIESAFHNSAFALRGETGGFGGHSAAHVGFRVVAQQTVNVVERLGKFDRVLEPGIHLLIPVVDRVAYVWHLKETAIPLPNQSAITKDNVVFTIDGVLYCKVIDAKKASYGIDNLYYGVVQLAQTTMRSELGKLSLDEVLRERDALNTTIAASINEASADWGIQCLRHEIRDINPPPSLRNAMEMQAEAERRKRATVLSSEGDKQSEINRAEGQKQRVILESEAAMLDSINRAKGEAEAILQRAHATAESVTAIAAAIGTGHGPEAVQMRVAEQYIEAFGRIAKAGTTVLLPSGAADPAAMVAQALAIYKARDRIATGDGGARGSIETGGSVAASAGAPTGQAAGPLGFAASGVPDQRAPRAAAHTPLPARSLRKESYAGDREE